MICFFFSLHLGCSIVQVLSCALCFVSCPSHFFQHSETHSYVQTSLNLSSWIVYALFNLVFGEWDLGTMIWLSSSLLLLCAPIFQSSVLSCTADLSVAQSVNMIFCDSKHTVFGQWYLCSMHIWYDSLSYWVTRFQSWSVMCLITFNNNPSFYAPLFLARPLFHHIGLGDKSDRSCVFRPAQILLSFKLLRVLLLVGMVLKHSVLHNCSLFLQYSIPFKTGFPVFILCSY